jgi:hypothetical protein
MTLDDIKAAHVINEDEYHEWLRALVKMLQEQPDLWPELHSTVMTGVIDKAPMGWSRWTIPEDVLVYLRDNKDKLLHGSGGGAR